MNHIFALVRFHCKRNGDSKNNVRSSASRFRMNENYYEFAAVAQSGSSLHTPFGLLSSSNTTINLNAVLYRAVHRDLIDCFRFVS